VVVFARIERFINKWASSATEEVPHPKITEITAPMRKPNNSQFSKFLGKSKSEDLSILKHAIITVVQ
jgi:hypothetical protein